MIDWVNGELTGWGKFMRCDPQPLGYPKQTIEASMQQAGFAGGGCNGNDGYIPPSVAKAEAAVLNLPHDLQVAVVVGYTTSCQREAQAKIVSRRLGRRVSRQRFNDMLDHAHHRIAGFYSGKGWA